MRPIIAVDVGTSSIRALSYAEDGTLLHSSAYEYGPTYHPSGEVRQSPSDWEKGAVRVVGKAATELQARGLAPEALTVTSQRASLISVDREGRALHDAIMWHDKTTILQCREIASRIPAGEIYRRTGLRVDSYFSAPKILQLRQQRKELFEAADCLLGVQDYVILKMTGERVTDYSQASRTLLFNLAEERWDEEILKALEIDGEKLPHTVPPGSICGRVCSDFALATGLAEGLPVVSAGGDQQVAAVGMGVFDSRTAEVTTGTGSFVLTMVDAPAFHEEMRTLCSYSAIAGKCVVEAGSLTTGIVFKWFADQFTESISPIDGAHDFEGLDELVRSSPAGANGVVLLPHFKGAAAPYWNPAARGVFFNLTLATRKADMARAIVEAIALEMRENLIVLGEIEGIDIRETVVAGGMTSFPLFNRIQADVYGTPIRKYPHTEASSFGAFLSASAAVGRYADVYEAYRALAPATDYERIETDRDAHRLYEAIGGQRRKLYEALHTGGVYETIPKLEELLYPSHEGLR